jgi:hypothetical protein
MASKDYLDAIVHTAIPRPNGNYFAKYHLIKNSEIKLQKFERFARHSLPGALHVNYYWRHLPDGKNFAFQRPLQ